MKTTPLTPRTSFPVMQKFKEMRTAAAEVVSGGGTELPKAPIKKNVVFPMFAGIMIAAASIGVTSAAGKMAAKIVKNDFSISKTFKAITHTLSKSSIK